MRHGIYKGIVFNVYDFNSLSYHIEPINVEDMDKCENVRFVEYQGHWYATVPKKEVEIICCQL